MVRILYKETNKPFKCINVSFIFFPFFLTERVHDPNCNLEAQRAILNKTPEKLSEYLSI